MLSISSMAFSQLLKASFCGKAVAGPWRQLGTGQWMTAAVGATVGLLLHWPAQAQDFTRRIVVAGGDLTEIVFALDAEDQLVGVDQTSTWPPQAQDLPQIGYVRRLSAEGVLSLDPDLLIAAHDAGPVAATGPICRIFARPLTRGIPPLACPPITAVCSTLRKHPCWLLSASMIR